MPRRKVLAARSKSRSLAFRFPALDSAASPLSACPALNTRALVARRCIHMRILSFALSVVAASGLKSNPIAAAAAATQPLGRRAALSSAAAAFAVGVPLSVLADTQAMYDEAQPGFDAAAEKRKAFQQKQKIFKKSWRKELSNLEFASNDAEAAEAIEALKKLIYSNGFEIPEGVRKMDLDQVYRTQKAKLNKETRLKFGELDSMVLKIVTVKPMGSD